MASLTLDVAQCTALNGQLSTGDVALIRDVLGQLRGANATGCLRAIAQSGLGKTAYRLTKHQDVQIALAAQAVCDYWRTLIPEAAPELPAGLTEEKILAFIENLLRTGNWDEITIKVVLRKLEAEYLPEGGSLQPHKKWVKEVVNSKIMMIQMSKHGTTKVVEIACRELSKTVKC